MVAATRLIGKPVISRSAMQDQRFDAAKSIEALGIHTCLCLPMKETGASVGVTYLDRRISNEPFDGVDQIVAELLNRELNKILYR